MNFIDECSIQVRAGDGGNGCAAFRRGRNTPRGGPAGGDGGRGGSVLLRADAQLGTLQDLRYQRSYHAQNGEHGQGRDRHGKGGADLIVPVPVGTVVKGESGEVLCDLIEAGQVFVAAAGGQGGLGNLHFATSTNQAPTRADPGTEGQERLLRLELKLLADVGLLGYPNVGKSTLIACVSRARPKIADYPFTTLVPNLGVVGLPLGAQVPGRTFVLADIPGLIEGAHRGQGLGHQFLRHLERTRVLIHLIEISPDPDRDPLRDWEIINHELSQYDPELGRRPQLVALTKLDVTEVRAAVDELAQRFAQRGVALRAISAVTGEGLADLLEAAWVEVQRARTSAADVAAPR